MTLKQFIIMIAAVILFFGAFFYVFIWRMGLQPILSQPTQQEYVEVMKKTIKEENSGVTEGTAIYCTYLVTFQFSDGTEKEFNVGLNLTGFGYSERKKIEIYNSFYEGDTGILTFKERKDIEEYKTEELRYDGRHFISFEKDPKLDQ